MHPVDTYTYIYSTWALCRPLMYSL